MKVLHLSWLKRSDGELGGVEKFASYLERALLEAGHTCQIVSWSDFPNRAKCERLSNLDSGICARTMSKVHDLSNDMHFGIQERLHETLHDIRPVGEVHRLNLFRYASYQSLIHILRQEGHIRSHQL